MIWIMRKKKRKIETALDGVGVWALGSLLFFKHGPPSGRLPLPALPLAVCPSRAEQTEAEQREGERKVTA